MNTTGFLSLFEAFGVELEYMIVADDSLSVKPITDEVLRAVAGSYQSEVELGDIAWSNELSLHVIELKTNGPTREMCELPELFHQQVVRINRLLQPHAARLMPTAMHPWMDPHEELRLWPHDYNSVYESFNRIFDCRGHGWANLQSVHLNLPFANDQEFGQLHAAIRLILPVLPALSASSPVIEERITGYCDTRLDVYRNNAALIPSVTGRVIPEAVYTRADYDRTIFQTMYRDIASRDPQGILQHEWLNARGAIARFDRQTIEIRVLDVQECPLADVSICAAIIGVLRHGKRTMEPLGRSAGDGRRPTGRPAVVCNPRRRPSDYQQSRLSAIVWRGAYRPHGARILAAPCRSDSSSSARRSADVAKPLAGNPGTRPVVTAHCTTARPSSNPPVFETRLRTVVRLFRSRHDVSFWHDTGGIVAARLGAGQFCPISHHGPQHAADVFDHM